MRPQRHSIALRIFFLGLLMFCATNLASAQNLGDSVMIRIRLGGKFPPKVFTEIKVMLGFLEIGNAYVNPNAFGIVKVKIAQPCETTFPLIVIGEYTQGHHHQRIIFGQGIFSDWKTKTLNLNFDTERPYYFYPL